jgi:hypothetical protein
MSSRGTSPTQTQPSSMISFQGRAARPPPAPVPRSAMSNILHECERGRCILAATPRQRCHPSTTTLPLTIRPAQRVGSISPRLGIPPSPRIPAAATPLSIPTPPLRLRLRLLPSSLPPSLLDPSTTTTTTMPASQPASPAASLFPYGKRGHRQRLLDGRGLLGVKDEGGARMAGWREDLVGGPAVRDGLGEGGLWWERWVLFGV